MATIPQNNVSDEFYELKRITKPIAYAMSANMEDTNLSRTLIYDVEKGVHVVFLNIGKVAYYLTTLNDEAQNLHYIRVGRWYVVNADSVLYVCPQERTLILAYNDMSYNHIRIKDIPEEALRKLRKELHDSPQSQKVILGNEDREFWFYPDEILYARTIPNKKKTKIVCMNQQEYEVTTSIGEIFKRLNRHSVSDRMSKSCIIRVDRLANFQSNTNCITLLDANDDTIDIEGLSTEAYHKYNNTYLSGQPKIDQVRFNIETKMKFRFRIVMSRGQETNKPEFGAC